METKQPKKQVPINPSRPRGRPKLLSRPKRQTIYLNDGINKALNSYMDTFSRERGSVSKSAIINKAIARYLKQEDSYWSLLFMRFNNLTAKVEAYTKRMDLLSNILMHYISYYFLNWPEYSPEEKEDASQKSLILSAKFLDSLKKRLQHGGYLQELSVDSIKDFIIENAKDLDLDELHAQADQEAQERQQKRAQQTQGASPST